MTEIEYAHLAIVYGSNWFNWNDVDYTARMFDQWKEQGLVEQNQDEKGEKRFSYWRLTELAHKTKGEQ
jgi:hypothetical protein